MKRLLSFLAVGVCLTLLLNGSILAMTQDVANEEEQTTETKTITLKFVDDKGSELINDYKITVKKGEMMEYPYKTPEIEGYMCSQPEVNLRVQANTTYYVMYHAVTRVAIQDVEYSVQYIDDKGQELISPAENVATRGAVEIPPTIEGYVSPETVRVDTTSTNVEVNETGTRASIRFIYSPKNIEAVVPPIRHLTISYKYEDGTNAFDQVVNQVKENDPFNIVTPHIDGYTPSLTVVNGKMGKEDISYEIVYVKDVPEIEVVPNGSAGTGGNEGGNIDNTAEGIGGNAKPHTGNALSNLLESKPPVDLFKLSNDKTVKKAMTDKIVEEVANLDRNTPAEKAKISEANEVKKTDDISKSVQTDNSSTTNNNAATYINNDTENSDFNTAILVSVIGSISIGGGIILIRNLNKNF